ncbi:uncharacterized protein V6R79_001305 [Siganus canaliculatus]
MQTADKTTCCSGGRNAVFGVCHGSKESKDSFLSLDLESSSVDLVCLNAVSPLIHAVTLPLTRRMALRGVAETSYIHQTV